MAKYAIASVGYGQAFDSQGNLLFNTTTLTDSGFTTSTSNQEIRGGDGNPLLGQYYHTSQFQVSMTDAVSDLLYVGLQVGSDVTAGADIYTTETVVTTVTNEITVTGTPQAFGTLGTIGWYTLPGDDGLPTKITFSGQTASVTGVPIGTTVCVTYLITDDSARVIEVTAAFVPSEVHLVFTVPLFKAGLDTANASTSSKIGEWIVDVPRFIFDGAISLATTSSTNVGFGLNGMALAYTTPNGCSNQSVYATITEVIYGKDEFANVSAIAIAGGDLTLAPAETATLEVYAIYNDGTAAKKLDNSKLTFTSGTPATATVGLNTGVVEGISAGDSVISVVVTTKTSLSDNCSVTITA